MAIKISGNTVIDDSRNITSSGTMSANAYIGDGSQLTNLPGGGNTLEATASGTLADGSKVIVNTDGTVSVVNQTSTTGPGVGDPTTFESADTRYPSATYDSANGKVVIAYADYANSNYGTAIVGTVSGTSISFGSPVVFKSADSRYMSAIYDSTNEKVVIAFQDGGNSYYGTAIVGTVSGTSISFGSSVVFESASTEQFSATYDSTNQKVVIAYQDEGNSDYGTAVVGTVSGTSISFGTPVVFESAGTRWPGATYDSTNQKVVIAYQDVGNSNYGTAIVGTVSGTSISFGSPVVFESASSAYFSAVYDSANQKVVIGYRDIANSDCGTAVVGTVSGTSISFGAPVIFDSANAFHISATYDSVNSKVLIAYRGTQQNYGMISVGTVSGTSISFTTMTFQDTQADYNAITFDSTNGKAVIVFSDAQNMQWYGKARVFSTTGYPVADIGTPTVFESAAIQHVSSTYTTNGKVVIAYRDDGNSYYGTAVVGTVSGTSISFGTPVVFESATTQHTSTVYDSANDKVVIVYSDNGDAARGTAVVGTISGTSISFGTPVAFRSSSCTYNSAVYDSANGKIVVAYQDGGNSDRGYTSVLTVSGTSITYGSYRQFESGRVDSIGTAYDSVNEKVVIAYQDGGSSDYGKAVVATTSGTENTFGTPVTFESAGTYSISAVYDSANQKVVIAYKDAANSYKTYSGTAIVGTVSGTSISFGTPTVFALSPNDMKGSLIYDSTDQKVIIAYGDAQTNDQGTIKVGTVSGTSISFGNSQVFDSDTSYYSSPVYDPTNDKIIIAYRDQGNSSYGTAVVLSPDTISNNLTSENFIGISDGAYSNGQTATIQLAGSVDDAQSSLTPGQKYFVQNDGTLSETADSPSVFAGTAVATTKLIVKN